MAAERRVYSARSVLFFQTETAFENLHEKKKKIGKINFYNNIITRRRIGPK